MKIWDTTDWKSLPERIRMEGLYSFNFCGKVILYQDDDMDEPVVLNPRWRPLETIISVLEFHKMNGIRKPMIPEGV